MHDFDFLAPYGSIISYNKSSNATLIFRHLKYFLPSTHLIQIGLERSATVENKKIDLLSSSAHNLNVQFWV